MSDQGDLFKARSRSSDPETSRDAADALSPEKITEGQTAVLRVLERRRFATDAEILKDLSYPGARISPSGARTRRAELVRRGLVVDSKIRTRLDSGNMARVWRVTTKAERERFKKSGGEV